jgi:glycine oxidase
MDAVVIGSGIIGLAVARELALRGAAVTVVDPNEPVRAASWAAAGMLAPYTEAIADPNLESLCARSLALYPAYAQRLHEESGLDPQLRLSGILDTAFDAPGRAALRTRAEALARAGVHHELLDADHVRQREPGLAGAVLAGLFVHGEGRIDNRRLGAALLAAARAAGVRVVSELGEVALEADARRVRGVRTRHGFLTAPVIVNAAGAWAAALPGLPESARPAVFPVKGQILALGPARTIPHVLWVPGAYLVPRDDGRLIVGATVEDAGFNVAVTEAGIRSLLDAAVSAVPALGDAPLLETWAGLRPGSSDGLPFIGPAPLEGLFDASGHARNGVLLAPVTAHAVADLIEGKPVPADVAACSPQRARRASAA